MFVLLFFVYSCASLLLFLRISALVDLGHETFQQLVLNALQLGDLLHEVIAMAGHGLGVALSLVMFAIRQGRFRHHRTKAGVVGALHEERELLLGNRELLTLEPQPLGDLRELPLQQ